MTSHSTIADEPQSERQTAVHLFDHWFDPIEAGLRDRAREFLHAMFEAELDEVLDRSRYARRAKRSSVDSERAAGITGHRHGHRSRTLLGTFGQVKIEVPRARLDTQDRRLRHVAHLPALAAGRPRTRSRLIRRGSASKTSNSMPPGCGITSPRRGTRPASVNTSPPSVSTSSWSPL